MQSFISGYWRFAFAMQIIQNTWRSAGGAFDNYSLLNLETWPQWTGLGTIITGVQNILTKGPKAAPYTLDFRSHQLSEKCYEVCGLCLIENKNGLLLGNETKSNLLIYLRFVWLSKISCFTIMFKQVWVYVSFTGDNECPASCFNLYNIYSFALIGSGGMLDPENRNCRTQRRPYLPKYRGARARELNTADVSVGRFRVRFNWHSTPARFYYRFYFMFAVGRR